MTYRLTLYFQDLHDCHKTLVGAVHSWSYYCLLPYKSNKVSHTLQEKCASCVSLKLLEIDSYIHDLSFWTLDKKKLYQVRMNTYKTRSIAPSP